MLCRMERPSTSPAALGASSPPGRGFVGRQAELDELSHALDTALAGTGRLYLLSGEPGIGKTRLCDELTSVAAARGVPVFWGRCWQAGGAPAYWPWLDVLSGVAERLPQPKLEQALGAGASALGVLVPAIAARLSAPSGSAAGSVEEARFALFRAVAGLLRTAATDGGLMLVLDDLHAADESSLLLVHFLAHELRSMKVFVLATFRDVEARLSVEVGEALARLTREGTLLSLARLGQADCQRFLRERAGALDPSVEQQIFRRTLGNPLFLEELARLLQSEGAAQLAAAPLPEGVREVIRQRLSRVPAPARKLLELAAISGDETEPALLADAAGTAALEVLEACAAAARAGVLVAREGQRFRFAHALIREVLERDLTTAERESLHGKVAAALERRSSRSALPPHAELAHHLLEASVDSLPSAVHHAVLAADRALSLFAFEDATTLLERACTAVERAGNPPRLRAAVLIALGQTQIRRGSGAPGQQLCLEAAELARALGDAQLLASAALAYGLEFTPALVNQALVALLKEALAALPVADTSLRVSLSARLAAAMQPQQDVEHPITVAREAIASARRIGDRATLLGAIYTGMSAMMDITHARERLPLNLEAEELAASFGDRERLLRTQARLVFDHMELGDLAGADARIDRFERLAQEAGARRYLWRVPLFRSMRALVHGRFEEAQALSQQALALGKEAADPQLERCYGFHHEGLLRTAERHEEMVAYDPHVRALRSALYSAPHWQNGGTGYTYARVEDLDNARLYLGLIPRSDWPVAHTPPAFLHLGEPLALVGERGAVQQAYEQLGPAHDKSLSWGWTSFLWDGPAGRVLGMLAARLQLWDAARDHFERAIEQLQRMEAKPYLARTRYEYARSLLLHGQPADGQARELLEQAAEGAAALHLTGLVRLAEQRLAQCDGGKRMSAAPTSHAATTNVAADSTAGLPFSFTQEGEYWSVSYAGSTFRMRDSLGLQYLARLFAEPGRELHVFELSAGKAASAAEAEVLDQGDAGELLDDKARESYRARGRELQAELQEAEAAGDVTRAERARDELDFLASELSRAVGLGGRKRRAGVASERARSAVQRRIRNALQRVAESSPVLAELLERSVKTGTVCVFRLENTRRS